MTWRPLTTRDPVLLKSADKAPDWFSPALELEARVVAILGVEDDAPLVVQLAAPSTVGLADNVGLHLVPAEAGATWWDPGLVEVRLFEFPSDSLALREGVVGGSVEGRLTYERRPFDLAEVFAEAETGGGSRMIDGAELSRLVEYARTRDAAVTFVETFELRDTLEIPRIDLGLYGLDGDDAGLTDAQRIDLAAGYVGELLALADAEDHRFGYRVWVWLNANR